MYSTLGIIQHVIMLARRKIMCVVLAWNACEGGGLINKWLPNSVEHVWNVMALFQRNGRVHLNWRGRGSVQSTTGSRGVRISGSNGSNAGYSMFWGRVQGYWLPTPLACFPITSPTVRHRVPSGFNWALSAGDIVSHRGDEVTFLSRREKGDKPLVRFVYFLKRHCSNCIGYCSAMEAVCRGVWNLTAASVCLSCFFFIYFDIILT